MMKTFAARPNPAFKIAQPLPAWPVARSDRNGGSTAREAGLFQTQAPAFPKTREFAAGASPGQRLSNLSVRSSVQ